MIAIIAFFKRLGTYPRIILAVAGVLILLWLVFSVKSCLKPKPKIDLEQIDRINRANEQERRKEVEKLVLENLDTTRAVDERTTLAERNAVERERVIDEKIAEVNQKIAESRREGRDVTGADLECLLVPENCK
jgi:uncharacterized membrane protein YhiD involved in acid resistance